MTRLGDWLVFLAAVSLIGWWIWRRFNNWLHEPPGYQLRRLAKSGGSIEGDETVTLLETHGYEVLSGKHRIPLGVAVDDGPMQATRLYFDYLASREDKYYLVKVERNRMPIEWTASGLRDRLLPYVLLFPECEGIVIADPKTQGIHTVRFKVEDDNG